MFLGTRDAHGLYERYGGFERITETDRWMARPGDKPRDETISFPSLFFFRGRNNSNISPSSCSRSEAYLSIKSDRRMRSESGATAFRSAGSARSRPSAAAYARAASNRTLVPRREEIPSF